MKKKFFMHAFVAFSFIMAGCSKNDVLNETESRANVGVLNVRVTEKSFEATDVTSRATDNGTATTFESGDKIGVYIVKDGKQVMQKNVALTFDGVDWNGTLYYYEGADYIAYYPYDESMSGVKSLDDIKEFFDDKYSTDQSSKEAYRSCDWMTAEVKAENVVKNGVLNLTLSHNMALLEFKIPTYSYKTSESNDAYAYGVPLVDFKININSKEYIPYSLSDGLFRCIVSPNETGYDIKGEFYDAKEYKPVEFNKEGVTMAANAYKRYNVTYENAPSPSVTVRAIQPGDYYYADGNIVPNDFTIIPEGCIGVVFSTTTNNETAKDGTTICSHGYVLALKDASTSVGGNSSQYKLWSTAPDDWTVIGITPKEETANEKTIGGDDFVNDNSGLEYTKAIVEKISVTGDGGYVSGAITTYDTNFPSYAAPESTTGWFVPSVGQWISVVRNLGGDKDFNGKESTDTDLWSAINAYLSKVDGANILGNGFLYYTSNLAAKMDGETVESYGSYVMSVHGKGDDDKSWNNIHLKYSTGTQDYSKYIRPILAF